MKQLVSTKFRLTFLDLTEPVEVTKAGEVVGEYSPRTAVSRSAQHGSREDNPRRPAERSGTPK